MRVNGTPRGHADLVAARVQALLSADGPDTAEPVDVWGDEGTEILPTGALPTRADRRRPERADPAWWERLAARVPVRLDPGRRGALAVGVAVVVAALATGAWLVSNRPQAVPVSASAPSVPGAGPLVGTDGVTEAVSPGGSSAAVPSATSSGTATQLVIDVAGRVRRPGVYRLPPGSRVDDAVRAAGGARGHADLSSLNLAALLVDGQQVSVGVPPAAGGGAVAATGGAVAGTGSGGAPATVVDLNTATLEQLETLPRVGPVLGQDILDYRSAHGSFTSIDQLKDVSGIGDVTFGDLQALVSV